MPDDIRAAIVGAVTAAALALLKGYLDGKAGVEAGVREKRLSAYPELWRLTSMLSTWPRTDVAFGDLESLHKSLRRWYYAYGGLYLSESARARYGELQQLLARMLAERERWGAADGGRPSDAAYALLEATASALRTALTEDLETRSKRGVWTSLRIAVRHGLARRRARARLRRLGPPPSHASPGREESEPWQTATVAAHEATAQGLK